ncbi:MAG TPA: glycosyltransferase family protein, partial [Candidatus Poseidoniales archaeon]|nr:glycosyltransferase family protein [Candidatus Poseidoniales archaeon]
VICDFEPTMWAVARRLKVPFITFDSQRFAVACKLRKVLPVLHRLLLIPIIGTVWFFTPRTNLAIISKPFDLPMSPRRRHTHLVGPILRDSIRDKTWQPSGEHILCYLRGRTESVLGPLNVFAGQFGLRVKLYGKPSSPEYQHIDECEISEEGFAQHMSTADLVISTAGTQVIGEVAHFGVPTVLVPEPGQIEQDINAVIAERVVATIRRRKVKRVDVAGLRNDLECLKGQKSTSFEDGSVTACRLIVQWMDSRMTNV